MSDQFEITFDYFLGYGTMAGEGIRILDGMSNIKACSYDNFSITKALHIMSVLHHELKNLCLKHAKKPGHAVAAYLIHLQGQEISELT